MPKPRDLAAALKSSVNDDKAPSKPVAKETPVSPSVKTALTGREGKKFIGGHYAPEVAKQLKILSAKTDKPQQELLAEALNLLFAKYGENPIA